MKLIEKIFNRSKGVSFNKNQILIYADNLRSLELREEKDYFIIGRYNDDRSQFENLATGEIYKLNSRYGNTMAICVNGRNYSLVSNYGKIDIMGDNVVMRTNAYGHENDFLTLKVAVDYKNKQSDSYKKLKSFYDYLLKTATSEIDIKEIKKLNEDMNNFAYDAIGQELEQNQTL